MKFNNISHLKFENGMRKINEKWPYKTKKLFKLIESQTDGNVSEFAIRIGVSQQRINRLFVIDKRNGEYPMMSNEIETMTKEVFELPRDYFVMPPTEVEVDPLEAFNNDDESSNNTVVTNKKVYDNEKYKPRVDVYANAGTLTEQIDASFEQMPVIAQLPKYDYTIITKGDSMEPEFRSGEEIACLDVTHSNFRQWGKPHVLNTSQGVVLKRIYQGERGYKCISDNKMYPDFEIPEDEVYSIGLVVGMLRTY